MKSEKFNSYASANEFAKSQVKSGHREVTLRRDEQHWMVTYQLVETSEQPKPVRTISNAIKDVEQQSIAPSRDDASTQYQRKLKGVYAQESIASDWPPGGTTVCHNCEGRGFGDGHRTCRTCMGRGYVS